MSRRDDAMNNKAAEILRSWQRDRAQTHGKKSAFETFTLETIQGRHLPLFATNVAGRALRQNTAIEACGRFLRTAVTEAEVKVMRPSPDGDDQPIEGHRLVELLRKPNGDYLGSALRAMIAWDLALTGSAYVVMTDTVGGLPLLHWFPSFSVEPRSLRGSGNLIDYFEVASEDGTERLAPERVIQFRLGVDPSNMRKGYSPLRALLREVMTDNEATEYTFYVLANTGVAGMIVSPVGENVDSDALLRNAPEIKQRLRDSTTGSHRGEPVVLGFPVKIEIPSFSPDQMALDKLRDIPEERITAVLGMPAAVVGLGTGLEQTKVGATMKELRRQAYEGGVVPLQSVMAETWTEKLLPKFSPASGDYVIYDNSRVKVFEEDENAKHARVRDDWRAGLLTLAQALTALGMKPNPGDDKIRIFDLTIGRFDARMNEAEKSAIYTRIRQKKALFDAMQLDLGLDEPEAKPQNGELAVHPG